MSRPWDVWPPAKPIRVEGGIKARSRRGAIGEQWLTELSTSELRDLFALESGAVVE